MHNHPPTYVSTQYPPWKIRLLSLLDRFHTTTQKDGRIRSFLHRADEAADRTLEAVEQSLTAEFQEAAKAIAWLEMNEQTDLDTDTKTNAEAIHVKRLRRCAMNNLQELRAFETSVRLQFEVAMNTIEAEYACALSAVNIYLAGAAGRGSAPTVKAEQIAAKCIDDLAKRAKLICDGFFKKSKKECDDDEADE